MFDCVHVLVMIHSAKHKCDRIYEIFESDNGVSDF